MQEKYVTIEKLAQVLNISKTTMRIYTDSYLISRFISRSVTYNKVKSYKSVIVLNDESIKVLLEYFESKDQNVKKSYVEKFKTFLLNEQIIESV